MRYAARGMVFLFQNEKNFFVEMAVAVCVVGAGIWFRLSRIEWLIVFLTIAHVVTFEIINSVVERLIDVVHPRLRYHVGLIKDMLAAAVLIASIAALLIGLGIFVPRIWNWWWV